MEEIPVAVARADGDDDGLDAWGGSLRPGLLRAENHRVDRVDGQCEEYPENRGEEQAANHLADWIGVEEATGFEKHWCLHVCFLSYR